MIYCLRQLKKFERKLAIVFVVVGVFVQISGCAVEAKRAVDPIAGLTKHSNVAPSNSNFDPPSQTVARDALIADRVLARWNALISGQFNVAYKYLSPGTQLVTTFDQYRAGIRAGNWKSVSIDSVKCESKEICHANVIVVTNQVVRGAGVRLHTSTIIEKWIEIEGEWWFVP
jgi:hypothetical protein